jgi:hypothetical protein
MIAWLRHAARGATPSLLMSFSVLVGYAMGEFGVDRWWALLPIVFGGFALGLSSDRAEARAKTEWADKFWRLIETDHMLEISVTHHNPPTSSTDGANR